MTSIMPPNVFNEQRGLQAAERAIRESISTRHGDGTQQITDNEVAKVFAAADQYMPNGEKVSTEGSLSLALKLLQNDVTAEGIKAIFQRFGIDSPKEDPVVDPGPGDIVVRPRYGLMETARPIIERANAGASEEDIARLQLLKALADRAAAGNEAPRARGRAVFNQPVGVRSFGEPSALQQARDQIGQALARFGIE